MNRVVLIADGDAARAARLEQACDDAQIAALVADHGARALELALAERPSLIVARSDLPLVSAPKLAEILRANPRTRDARFLFLSDESQAVAGGGVGDQWLSGEPEPPHLVQTLRGMLDRLDRLDRLGAEGPADGEREGDLAHLPLAELLQLFQVNRRSGHLDLVTRDERGEPLRGHVWLREGEIIRAQVGTVEKEKAVLRMLAWTQGRFHFEPGSSEEAPQILTPTRALLVEGVRQAEEASRLAGQLPPLDAQVKLRVKSSELPHIVHPLTQEVLLLLEIYTRVRDVVDHCAYPDYQVLRTLHTLVGRDIVRLGRIAPAPATGAALPGLFDEAQLRRLREWTCGPAARRGGARRDAKLLVAAADERAPGDFARLLARVPGVRVSPGVVERGVPRHSLETIARISLDEDTGIELIHMPSERSFAPLWPLSGHGALGVLFLLGAEVGPDARKVRAMTDAFQRSARARVFHVALLDKGERISPDDLRDNLALIDEASLFLLPTESNRPPVSVLRGLFARIVP